MKAAIIAKSTECYSTIKESILSTQGIFNVVEDVTKNKFLVEYATHNTIEGLREKLIALNVAIEFIYL